MAVEDADTCIDGIILKSHDKSCLSHSPTNYRDYRGSRFKRVHCGREYKLKERQAKEGPNRKLDG